jgi:hypothetical protein
LSRAHDSGEEKSKRQTIYHSIIKFNLMAFCDFDA